MQGTRFTIVAAILLSLALVGPLCVTAQPQLPGAPGQCNTGCCNLGRTVFEGACSSFVSASLAHLMIMLALAHQQLANKDQHFQVIAAIFLKSGKAGSCQAHAIDAYDMPV